MALTGLARLRVAELDWDCRARADRRPPGLHQRMLVLAKPERPAGRFAGRRLRCTVGAIGPGSTTRSRPSDNLRSRPGGLPGVPNLRSRRLGSVWSAHTLSAGPV